jgi:hypothetical protein
MKKILVLVILLLITVNVFSQIKIGADGAGHATGNYPWYIAGEGKGLSFPLADTNARNAILPNYLQNGQFIYTVADSSMWRLDSTQSPVWVLQWRGSLYNTFWNTLGNFGTNPTINYLGTNDAQPLVFKVNGQLSGYIGLNRNTFFGNQSPPLESVGIQNVTVGDQIMINANGANNNTLVGHAAGIEIRTGGENTGMGFGVFNAMVDGSYNTASGFDALHNNISGIGNLSEGYHSGYGSIGNYNIFSGPLSGSTQINGDSNIYIGYNVQPPFSTTANNQLNIGNWVTAYNNRLNLGIQNNSLVAVNTDSLNTPPQNFAGQDNNLTLHRYPLSSIASNILPDGLVGQVNYYTKDNTYLQQAGDLLNAGKFVYTDAQLSAMENVFVSQATAFSTYQRFAHGGVSGAGNDQFQANNDTIPNLATATNSFSYDSVAHQINSTFNTGSYIGIITPSKLSNYTISATISAHNNADNDRVGLVAAYVNDYSRMVKNNALGLNPLSFTWPINVTDTLIPFQHTISVYRNRNGSALAYYVIYDAGLISEKLLFDGTSMLSYTPTTNWQSDTTECQLQVVRVGNVIKVFTTEFADNPSGGQGSLGHEIDINLLSDTALTKFLGATQFGFTSESQAFSYWQNLSFTDNSQYIYDLRNGNVYTPNTTGVYTVNDTLSTFTSIGIRRYWYNPYFGTFGYINPDSSYYVISNKDTLSAFAQIDTSINISFLPSYLNNQFSYNENSCIQTNTLIYKGNQYAIFISDSAYPIIAKRPYPDGQWQTYSFGTSFGTQLGDLHNFFSMGFDSLGFIHILGNMHDAKMNYCVSNAAESILSGFTFKFPLVDSATESSVTYPRLFNDTSHNLYLHYRQGTSGNGNTYLDKYTVRTGTWSRVSQVTSGGGTNNFYENGMFFDKKNRLHVSGVWRLTTSANSNKDLSYFYSDNGGVTFKSIGGNTYTLPITDATSLPIQPSDTAVGLINQAGMDVDTLGRVHIVNWWNNSGNTQIRQWYMATDTSTFFTTRYLTSWAGGIYNLNIATLNGAITRPIVFSYNGSTYALYTQHFNLPTQKSGITVKDITPEHTLRTFNITGTNLINWEAATPNHDNVNQGWVSLLMTTLPATIQPSTFSSVSQYWDKYGAAIFTLKIESLKNYTSLDTTGVLQQLRSGFFSKNSSDSVNLVRSNPLPITGNLINTGTIACGGAITAGGAITTNNNGGMGMVLNVVNTAGTEDQRFQRQSLDRWIWRMDATAEASTAYGSDLNLISRNVDGSIRSTVLFVKRSTGSVFIGSPSLADTTYMLSVNGTIKEKGGFYLLGSSSGLVSILPQAAAGTYNFNLPITAGTAGQVLTSQAGGSTAMTWSNVLTGVSVTSPMSNILALNITGGNTVTASQVASAAGTVLANMTGSTANAVYTAANLISTAVSYGVSVPTTGGTVNLVNNSNTIIEPTGSLVSLTIVFPATPVSGDRVIITFNQAITTVTYNGNGNTVAGQIISPIIGMQKLYTFSSGVWH